MDQTLLNMSWGNDDNGDRPTLPARRTKGGPVMARAREQARFDATAEHFFSNAVTQPELVLDATILARMTEAATSSVDEDVSEWWAAQRRAMHLRVVAVLVGASVALLFVGALR